MSKTFLKEECCFLAGAKPELKVRLWHLRLGHLNEKDVKRNVAILCGVLQSKEY